MQIFFKKLQYSYIQHAIIHLQEFLSTKLWVRGGGHWGKLETAKPKEKIIQNRKTAKKFGQNRKPHTKPSKTDTMVTSGAYRAN